MGKNITQSREKTDSNAISQLYQAVREIISVKLAHIGLNRVYLVNHLLHPRVLLLINVYLSYSKNGTEEYTVL